MSDSNNAANPFTSMLILSKAKAIEDKFSIKYLHVPFIGSVTSL